EDGHAAMGFDVDGGVPERHDAIADILVDGALAVLDDTRHRGEEGVDDMGELLRIEAFRKLGEAADVAEHDGEFAQLATKLETFRMLRQLVDQDRREVARESPAHMGLLP